jgi:polar amino acid transport system substrate-binding protein
MFSLSIELQAEPVKSITIGSPLNSPPYVFEGEAKGIELELVSALIKKMGYMVSWRHLPPKRIRHQVLQREIGAGIRTLPSPGDGLFYSRPYISFQNVAIALDPKVQINSIQDLSKYSVVAYQNAKEFLGPDYAKAVSACSVYLELANQEKQIETLFRRRSQVIVMEKRIFHYFRDMLYPTTEVKIFDIFQPTAYTVVFSDKAMRDEFDRALQAKNQGL